MYICYASILYFMVNSKLITLLKTLDNAELKAFEHHINCSKQAGELVVFFDHLKKYHPKYTNKYVVKEAFCKKFYPKLKPDAQKISKMMNKLVDHLNEFMIQQELKKDEIKKDFLLLSAYQNRRLDNLFFKTVKKVENKWENEKPPGLNQLYNEFELKSICFRHPAYSRIEKKSNNPTSSLKTKEDKSLIGQENLLEQIDRYYFATKLYLTLSLRHTQKYISNPDKFSKKEFLVNEIMEICIKGEFDDALQIKLFSQILHSLDHNYENYNQLKKDFVTIIKSFNKDENLDIINCLLSICYENYKKGKPNTLRELFELNSLMIKHNLLVDDGHVTTELFSNIITISLAAKELKWTKNFIAEYGNFLYQAEKDDILCISKSQLAFEEGNFNESLQYLLTIKFHNISYGLRARAIQLKCYYELGLDYQEPFFSLIKSFSDFMRRNNFSEDLQKSFLNFISLTRKLYLIKHNSNKEEITTFTNKLNVTENVASISWLKSKINEMN